MIKPFSCSRLLFLSVIVLFFCGCNDFKHLSDRGKLLVKTKEQLFRGVDFDMKLNEVRELEEIQPHTEYADYLLYRISGDSIGKGETIDVEYFFNKKNQLDLIIAFYNLSDKTTIRPLVQELKGYYEKKYGKPKEDEFGWFHWEIRDKSGEKGVIEINLVGETEEGYMGVELELIKYYEYEKRK